MEIRHLTAFVAVAEELHFGRAARRLQMAQPPLSQQIRQLERELGVQLFERNTRSVRLTSAGEAFLGPARKVLEDLDLAARAARAAGRGEYGRVTIGFAGASSHNTLPLLTRAVRAAHPGIELVLLGQTYANVALAKVAEGSLDLGFVRLPVTTPGIETRVIGEEELVCALPADHPLAGCDRIDLADLAGEPFVSFPANAGSSLRDATVKACVNAGFHPRIVQEAPDSYTILALVAAGVGVTLTLSSCLHVQQTGLVYRRLAGPGIRLQAALAWRSDNPSAALRAVLAVAEQALPTPRPATD
ncbi:LysR family transcriptional regulator [Thermobispora bispora]|jgi:DNA-binding transcriptional LysR family regulator|uniref:Transcriptional regulator, LysR family n=1 Tax=Thermobispora bispora (strain ATCC 19993 / DSM 43833 / CBS 139.67 / JCM 10125 / KCTC 9307 / NBRC 14880 / R51) TaxID=469371 RepID=D6YBF5_THEBD|nr:LysR family transcriptional regulator [Thermobispora bispora]ADG88515.1 transcriptional regulator, LysR family [Thermobispora bispora DSM 43833]MBX6169291.1 LysR family transcriptional regulator [Thermobispora bispora]MDI9582552.1 LysR family transcriptional regulator [Thermobispora sp.]QSI48319.1 LysR family transcriptional regulator [Thermobispora bispora]